jgi:beta-xylosidase
MFNMREWLAYSTTDMRTWTDHGPIMRVADFKWAKQDAWASQMIEKDGRFWFYAAVEHDGTHPGKAIAVAVSDSPTGPFVDAKGSALITNEMTPRARTAGRTSIRPCSPMTTGRRGSPGATASATSPGSSPT